MEGEKNWFQMWKSPGEMEENKFWYPKDNHYWFGGYGTNGFHEFQNIRKGEMSLYYFIN